MIKFETINGTLCRMVEPTPLQLDSPMPCMVRYIQDCSPMGRYLKRKYAMVINTVAIVSRIGTDGRAYSSDKIFVEEVEVLEIIGCPVVEGSHWWALYQMMQGKIVSNNSFIEPLKLYQYTIYTIGGKAYCSANEFVDTVAHKYGWHLYEPQPKPKPLLADAKVGDLCKHRNGDWSQIIDTNGTYIPGQPIRTTLKDTNGINRNFCLSGSHFTMQFGGEYDIIATEPLAPEGSAEWAWQMLILQKPVSHPAEGIWLDTYYSKDGFVRCMAKTGWHLYEPQPEPEFAVGDWVEIEVSGVLSQQQATSGAFADSIKCGGVEFYANGNPVMQPLNARIIRKLSGCEVKVRVTLEGTVSKDYDETLDNFILNNADGHTRNRIKLSTIDTPTREMVERLLKAQEGER